MKIGGHVITRFSFEVPDSEWAKAYDSLVRETGESEQEVTDIVTKWAEIYHGGKLYDEDDVFDTDVLIETV